MLGLWIGLEVPKIDIKKQHNSFSEELEGQGAYFF